MPTANNNPFKKATAVSKKLKILFTGPAGSGKTQALMTAPGLTIIDTERSTDLYLDGTKDINIARTMELTEIEKLTQYIRDNPTFTEVVGLDSVTPVYQVLLEANQKRIDAKGLAKESPYTKTNSQIRYLYNDFVNLPCHVIITARETINYRSQNGFFVADGIKTDASRDIDYLFDFIIRFDMEHRGHVEKQRGNRFILPEILPVVTWDIFAPIAEAYANGEVIDVEDERKVLDRTASLSTAKPMPEPPAPIDPDDMTVRANAMAWVGKWQDQGVKQTDLKMILGVEYFSDWKNGIAAADTRVIDALKTQETANATA